MRRGFPGLVAVCVVLICAPATAEDLKEMGCGRSLEKDGAAPQLVMDQSLHVLDQTRAGKFDPGAPPPGYTVKSIFCARSDVVPAPSDYKVVQAGYPLTIFARAKDKTTRIAVLEMSGGQLRVRSVGEAGFTPDMVNRIQAFLDASLPEFGKIAPSR
ncbi:MAG TPA: hypothetical protein VN175_07095 [Rhizomicrobium sp.]|nr:hypothetical protein [Rhizomicrobium sp.]